MNRENGIVLILELHGQAAGATWSLIEAPNSTNGLQVGKSKGIIMTESMEILLSSRFLGVMTYMASLMVLLAISSFALAMGFYGVHLIKTKKPVSYFELRKEGELGNREAAFSFVFWNLSIMFAVIAAVFSLVRFFI